MNFTLDGSSHDAADEHCFECDVFEFVYLGLHPPRNSYFETAECV